MGRNPGYLLKSFLLCMSFWAEQHTPYVRFWPSQEESNVLKLKVDLPVLIFILWLAVSSCVLGIKIYYYVVSVNSNFTTKRHSLNHQHLSLIIYKFLVKIAEHFEKIGCKLDKHKKQTVFRILTIYLCALSKLSKCRNSTKSFINQVRISSIFLCM